MHIDLNGNLVVEMPDIDVKCPKCNTDFTVDGSEFKDLFLEPLASAECNCESCGHSFYAHIKEA